MHLLLHTLTCVLLYGGLAAQPTHKPLNPARLIPVNDLRADFRLMRAALEATHAGLYWYTPKDSLNAVFDRTCAAINKPMTEQAFINLLYPAICHIRCGHTQIEHSVAYQQSSSRPKAVHLPFDVFVREDQAWLLKTPATDSTIQAGSELLSINQVPITKLIQTGLSTWNGDGFNRTWKEFFLNEYNFFDDMCWSVYGWTGPYELQLKQPDGTVNTVTVSAKPHPASWPNPTPKLSATEEQKRASQQAEQHKRSYLSLKFLPDSVTALLTVNALEYGDEAFYQQSFEEIARRKSTNLILDIRRNHGGDGRIINNLLSYLADSSYVLLKRIVARKANPADNPYASYFDPGLTGSYTTTYAPSRHVDKWYQFDMKPKYGRLTGYQPMAKRNRFRHSVYVLIDGGTFSNGSNFAAALKAQCKKAVFVGRETGGTEAGCGGGTNNKLMLPNSKIVLQIPWMRLISASRKPDTGHGVLPDYPVIYTPQAIAEHQDLDLEEARKLILKHTTGKQE